jgi:hypothetical protein
MSVEKIKKNLLVSLLLLSIFLSGNCFGKFALVRKIYEVNDGLTFGASGKLGGVIKSIVMIVFVILPVYSISFFLDIIVFNLIEFWTDKNPMALNEKPVQELASEGNTSISKKVDGDRMDLIIKNNQSVESIVVFKNKPGKFYTEKNSKLEEIKLNSMEFGSVSILSMESANGTKKHIVPSYLIEEAQNVKVESRF